MSDYKINPRTGKFDMVGTTSGTPGNGSEYALPMATDEILGGVKVAGNSDIQINENGFIATKYAWQTVYMNVDSGDDGNDGSLQNPVKSLSQALNMIYAKGTIYIQNVAPVINIPTTSNYIYDKEIIIQLLNNNIIKEVNIISQDSITFLYDGIFCYNCKFHLYSWYPGTGQWPVSLIDFNIQNFELHNSDCYVMGSLKVNSFSMDRGTLFVTDKFWIDAENSTSRTTLNWMANCMITCSEFNSVNSAGKNSSIRNKGGTVLVGKEIMFPAYPLI